MVYLDWTGHPIESSTYTFTDGKEPRILVVVNAQNGKYDAVTSTGHRCTVYREMAGRLRQLTDQEIVEIKGDTRKTAWLRVLANGRDKGLAEIARQSLNGIRHSS